MKLLLSLIFTLSWCQTSIGSEIDSISLIFPVSYERTPGKMQGIKSSVGVWVGGKVGLGDIDPKIRESIAPFRADLAPYFKKPGELDQLISNVIREANDTIVQGSINDRKVILLNQFIGTALIVPVINKILEGEGVTDLQKRRVWSNKILAPFNQCIQTASNGLYAADHCMTALTSSIVPNLGTALVYELANDNLTKTLPEKNRAAFNYTTVEKYKTCARVLPPNASNVKMCALRTMKDAVLEVSNPKLMETLNASATSKANAQKIKNVVWGSYQKCVDEVGTKESTVAYSDQVINCVDQLVVSAGSEVIKDKIENTDAIKSSFTKADLQKISKEKTIEFKTCINQQKNKNQRIDGMLDTLPCETKITNDLTYQVILKTMKDNAQTMLKGQNKEIQLTVDAGKKSLDSCWSADQNSEKREACVRKSLIVFTRSLALVKLDAAVPKQLNKSDSIKQTALLQLTQCLEKELPKNVTEDSSTTSKITNCADRLTKNMALTVAEAQIRDTAAASFTEEELDEIIQKEVKEKFQKCLGATPSDQTLDLCTDKLKINVAELVVRKNAESVLTDRPDQDIPQIREGIIKSVMDNFIKCLSSSKNKDACSDELQKEATRSVVVNFGNIEAKTQLNAVKIPSKIKPIEDEFIKCTKAEVPSDKLSAHLDKCNQKYAIEFARTLGEMKLNDLLKNALGAEEFNRQKDSINKLITSYNQCLNHMYKFSIAEGLTDRITGCTAALESKAVNLVRDTLQLWMASNDPLTSSVFANYANALPCLSAILPSSPYSQENKENVDSILKPIAIMLADYIKYDPKNAQKSLNEILVSLSLDIKSTADSLKTRSELVALLYKNGTLDQLIKSMVQSKIQEAFSTLSEKDLPKSIRDQLITKGNLDEIFNSAEGKAIKDFVHDNILSLVLIHGMDMSSPLVEKNTEEVNNRVIKMLVASPKFGDVMIKSSIQTSIDNMGGFTKFFAKVLYGSQSLNWDNVRQTPAGLKAEEYIRENILLPKFKGNVLSKEQEEALNKEAEKLVTEAVKSAKK